MNTGNSNTTTTTTSSSSTRRTILRIKRRRTEEPLPYIRLEGLHAVRQSGAGGGKRNRDEVSIEANVGDGGDTRPADNKNNNNIHRNRSTTAVWKRFEPHQAEAVEEENNPYRIVNAMLTEEENGNDNDNRQTKRRKLTVLETTTSDLPSVISLPYNKNTRKQPIRVFDPLTRMVDDSLQEVHIGNKSVSEHYRFITTDSNLMYDSKKWLAWCNSEGGNLLHACALWNDIEMASELLNMISDSSSLTDAVDADGRTPYEVAQLSAHDSVCEILEAFGGDTCNFVYDIFCLDDDQIHGMKNGHYQHNGGTGPTSNSPTSTTTNGMEDDEPMFSVELTAGVGYWTPDGELVLEAPEKSPASLDHVFDEDGEIDSNCEEYGGNDYPDDEEDDDDWDNDDVDAAFLYNQRHNIDTSIDLYREEADYNDLVHSGYDS